MENGPQADISCRDRIATGNTFHDDSNHTIHGGQVIVRTLRNALLHSAKKIIFATAISKMKLVLLVVGLIIAIVGAPPASDSNPS